jgi:hypothetical protein
MALARISTSVESVGVPARMHAGRLRTGGRVDDLALDEASGGPLDVLGSGPPFPIVDRPLRERVGAGQTRETERVTVAAWKWELGNRCNLPQRQ